MYILAGFTLAVTIIGLVGLWASLTRLGLAMHDQRILAISSQYAGGMVLLLAAFLLVSGDSRAGSETQRVAFAVAVVVAAIGVWVTTPIWQKIVTDADQAQQELSKTCAEMLDSWIAALDVHDPVTKGHSERVVEATISMARAMRIPEPEVEQMRRGALLHDLGKLVIPSTILMKPGPLDEAEWEVMRRHPVHAYTMLQGISWLRTALDIPLCHHERWDGSGYPYGLMGPNIPLAARIFAVIDVWDAMVSDRPYRAAHPITDVVLHLQQASGRLYDPQVVAVFVSQVLPSYEQLRR